MLYGVQKSAPIKVSPLLQALKNNGNISQNCNLHNEVVKKFASALFGLVGRCGYNLLQTNLGAALPSINITKEEANLQEDYSQIC